jgi:hypothetical protein
MQVSGGSVTFEPGARSAGHTHPAGQQLIVSSGVGWAQDWYSPNGAEILRDASRAELTEACPLLRDTPPAEGQELWCVIDSNYMPLYT